MDRVAYLAELRQLAAVARTLEDYTRIMERVERVCDSIEHDIGLSQLYTEDVQLYRCLECGSTWWSRTFLDGSNHDDCGGPVSKVRG